MDPKTARKYLVGRVLGQMKPDQTWRTRSDPFVGIWDEGSAADADD